jgi:dTDP-4-dehydrorhamnose 3,5-epimerase
MEFTRTQIPDVVVIDPVVFEDERGFLMETWQAARFRDAGIDATFVQDVHSRSAKGVIRGLHYQIERAQGKLIRVIRGDLFDVAVDLRRSSPTFGQWVGETLSAGNRRLMWVPAGFAHGFMVLSEYAEIEYRMTDYHSPEHGRSIVWDDPDIGIDWPRIDGHEPTLSPKDMDGVSLKDAETYE